MITKAAAEAMSFAAPIAGSLSGWSRSEQAFYRVVDELGGKARDEQHHESKHPGGRRTRDRESRQAGRGEYRMSPDRAVVKPALPQAGKAVGDFRGLRTMFSHRTGE